MMMMIRGRRNRGHTYIPNRPFTSIIPHEPRPRPRRPNTRNVDNHTPFLPLNRLVHPCITSQIDTLDIDIEHPFKFLFGHVCGGLVRIRPARVVDEYVAASELLEARGHGGRPVCGFGHVHFVEGEGGGRGGGRGFAACAADVADEHFAAFGCEAFGDSGAEA